MIDELLLHLPTDLHVELEAAAKTVTKNDRSPATNDIMFLLSTLVSFQRLLMNMLAP